MPTVFNPNLSKGLWVFAALILIVLTAACTPAAPALELTESYESLQSPLTFQYPQGWEVSTLPDSSVVVVSRNILLQEPREFQPEDCGMIATTFSPQFLSSIVSNEPQLGNILKSNPPTASEVLDLLLNRIGRTADERRALEIDGQTAEYAILEDDPDDDDNRQIGLLVIADPNGNYIYMQPIASEGELKTTCENTFLAMAETIETNPDEQ